MSFLYDYIFNTRTGIKSLGRYGKEVFFGILYVSLSPLDRKIAQFMCARGKTRPDLPTLSLIESLQAYQPDHTKI